MFRIVRSLPLMAMMLGLALPATAATEADPLDAQLDACLAGKQAETTYGMVDCTKVAAAAWDKRLNAAYQKLMKTLDPASRMLLRTAQRAWLDYRQKDADFASGPWRASNGTLAEVGIASTRLDELRARALALEGYARGE